MSRQNEWNVWIARPGWGLFSSILLLISDAALSEKVRARMFSGFMPWSIKWRIFSVITQVLPEPGPARMSWNPQVFTAVSWEGLRGMVS